MPPNLRKSQPNLSKPSQGGSFNAGKKPSESTNSLQGLNVSAERELGNTNGIKVTGKLTVGVDNLIAQQGLNVEIDANNKTVGVGLNVGSPKGKLGVNIGGKIGYGSDGKISIRGAEAAINIGGFGGSASIDDEKGIGGSISVAGAKIEVTVTPDGKKSLSLCYGVPGGELCVTFEPDPGITKPSNETNPTPSISIPPEQPATKWTTPNISIDAVRGCTLKFTWTEAHRASNPYSGTCESYLNSPSYYPYNSFPPSKVTQNSKTCTERIRNVEGLWAMQTTNVEVVYECELNWIIENFRNQTYLDQVLGYVYYYYIPSSYVSYDWYLTPYGGGMPIVNEKNVSEPIITVFNCTTAKPELVYAPPVLTELEKVSLPNYPQQYKPMECCDKIDEIYKYLGIAKLKKNKMKLAKALMVPKGKGDEMLDDYYEIMESIFRVLANGSIFNPISKPLGVEYQNTNATSWAGEIYEMIAEAKSNGDSTQRFEMLASFQLVQMMKVLAEQKRMIECLSEAIGITPDLSTEEVPVMFTIHEAHKGFSKDKQPKEIDIGKAKTDDQVEAVLGKVFKPSKIPITKWIFNPNHISISEAINKL